MKSPSNSSCSLKASWKGSVPLPPLPSSAFLSNATSNSELLSWNAAPSPCKATNADLRNAHAAPTKPSARSSASAFSTPMLQRQSSPKNFARAACSSARAASNASSPNSACKKKLYKCRPGTATPIDTYACRRQRRQRPCAAATIETGVRQILADRVSGNLVGLWLLIPEHLRLGTWDLLCGWTQLPGTVVEPRLALQLVHEAALCLTGLRERQALQNRGFELANGLPFVATDVAIHQLLAAHTVAQAKELQLALGKLRRASNHFRGR